MFSGFFDLFVSLFFEPKSRSFAVSLFSLSITFFTVFFCFFVIFCRTLFFCFLSFHPKNSVLSVSFDGHVLHIFSAFCFFFFFFLCLAQMLFLFNSPFWFSFSFFFFKNSVSPFFTILFLLSQKDVVFPSNLGTCFAFCFSFLLLLFSVFLEKNVLCGKSSFLFFSFS